MSFPSLVPVDTPLGLNEADTIWFPPGAKTAEYWLQLTPNRKIWIQVVGTEHLGKAVPVLALHGGPGACHDYIVPGVAGLASERAVVFYDQLGCGYSTVPPTEELNTYGNIEYYVSELVQVREALKLDHIHLWGSSWGSMLAVEYLLREKPKGVVSVTLAGSALNINMWQADADYYVSLLDEETQKIIAKANETQDFESEAYVKATDVFNAKHLCRTVPVPQAITNSFAKLGKDVYVLMNGPTEFNLSGTFKGYDITPRLKELPEITKSILYTCGDFDEAAPATSAYYQKVTPGAELAVIPQASHCHHAEQPEIYQLVMRGFFKRAEAAK